MKIGDYQVLGELGRGAMGVVYRARAPQLERDVALKLLPRGTSERQRERLRREAYALARLRHPHVVGVHHVGEHEGQPYFAMEFVEGKSLEAWLAGRGPLSPAYAAELFAPLARALAHAHACEIVHRDLKPANVLISSAGKPYLADFGLAKDLASFAGKLTQEGALVGTPGYWSPEQARADEALGPPSDVYSLGATLYAALTGEPPFTGDSLAELAIAVQERTPTPPAQRAPQVPRALSALCMRCLEKDPARRPTAEALAEGLERFLAEGSDAAPARRRGGLALAGLGAAALCAVGAWALGRPWTPRAPAPDVTAASADDLAARGAQALEREDPRAALAAYQAALDLDPTHGRAMLGLGAAYFKLRDLSAAIHWLDRGLALHPDDALALLRRGVAFYERDGPQRALPDLERSLALDAENPLAQFNYGVALNALGEPSKAEAAFSRAYALYGDDPEAYGALFGRAAARSDLHDFAGAEQDLLWVLEHEPDSVEARFNLGWLYERSERWREAAQTFRTCLTRLAADDPRRPRVREALARAEARVSASDPDLTPAEERLLAAAHAAIDAGRLSDALDPLRQLAQARPSDSGVYNLTGTVLASLGRHPEALAEFERAHALSPDPALVFNLGLSRLALDDFAGALADLERYVAAKPDDPEGYKLRGQAHAGLGHTAQARQDLLRALELFPRDSHQAPGVRALLEGLPQ